MVYVRRFEPGLNSEAFEGQQLAALSMAAPKNAGVSFHTAGEPSDHDLAWSGGPGYHPRIFCFLSAHGAAVLILFL